MFTLFLTITSIWVITWFFDYLFKSCMFLPYIRVLEFSGIHIKPFSVSWYITRLNRPLQKLGHFKPNFIRQWFTFGTSVTFLLAVPVLLFLITVLYHMIFPGAQMNSEYPVVQPAVPGVNLPLRQILYYALALLICSVFHELGHIIAASREGVHIHGCGFSIAFIFPFAFVDLHDEQLQILPAWKQLNIFCAGVWHNVVLVAIAFSLLVMNPVLLPSAFNLDSGITVIDIEKESGLSGPTGLTNGNHIIGLNLCNVHDVDSWEYCISEISALPQDGYCTSKKVVSENSYVNGAVDCCEHSDNSSICFTYQISEQVAQTHACLPVRKLLRVPRTCSHNSHCRNYEDGVCVSPVLKPSSQRLIQIFRKDLDSVLYIGHPTELERSITVSPWTPKFEFLPVCVVYMYETLLQYIYSFSGALVIINLVPCPRFDGYWLYHSLIEFLLPAFMPQKAQREVFFLGLMGFGCCLISGILFMSFYNLYITYLLLN